MKTFFSLFFSLLAVVSFSMAYQAGSDRAIAKKGRWGFSSVFALLGSVALFVNIHMLTHGDLS